MTQQPISAYPPLEHIAPNFNPLIFESLKPLLPLWLHWKTPINLIEAKNALTLAQYYQKFEKGENRFLLAFRHPSLNDAYCMAYLLWKIIPQVAKDAKIELKRPVHAHFMYNRGIPILRGEAVGWLYSQMGGTSIKRGKSDLKGIKTARKLFSQGKFPIAAAPEGAINGHSEIVSPLEPGIAQLGFWCVEDLKKLKQDKKVFIIPIGIQYFYQAAPWSKINQLLNQLEKELGIVVEEQVMNDDLSTLYQRLYSLGERILTLLETFYHKYYPQEYSTVKIGQDKDTVTIGKRLNRLLDLALTVAENGFNIKAKGNYIDRSRRLEQAGWDWIYQEALHPNHTLSPVEKALADRMAEEANLKMWHMRMVESFVAVTGSYVREKPTAERFAETLVILKNLVNRIKKKTTTSHLNLGRQTVKMTVAEPINVSERWLDYRKERRTTVEALTQDLHDSLERLIIK